MSTDTPDFLQYLGADRILMLDHLFPLYEGQREYPLQRVLILGERGTGKERIAELVGKTFCTLSNQTEERYYPVNAAALPEGLLESTLFGHVKGSFSGAYKDQIGFIERAGGGGTIFLDEIGEASSRAQVKLLRVLQTGEYDRVGEFGEARKARFHVVAATNRSESDLRLGQGLREDLFDRLSTSTFRVPPVRTLFKDPRATRRVLDWLADSVAKELGLVSGLEWYKNAKRVANLIADSIASRLGDYPWPGNLREITKLIHQVFRLGESHLDKLVSEMKDTFQEDPITFTSKERSLPTERLEIRLEAFEKRQYADAASKAHTIGEVANSLGVTRQTAARALKRYNLRLGKLVKEAM